MALWVCGGEGGCGTKYAVGLFRCPRCHNTAFFEDGDPMAKITRHSGASDKTLPTPDAAAAEPEPMPTAAADQPDDGLREAPGKGEPMHAVDGDELAGDGSGRALPPIPDEEYGPDAVPLEGGEGSSPGSSSSASTSQQPPSSEPSSKPTPKRARKTASRSGQAPTESSSALSTDGDQETATSATDGVE